MQEQIVEYHPWKPFLPGNARILMLGSFPPPASRWSMDFYYPNLQNDMWRLMGMIFFTNKEYFLTENKKAFHLERIKNFLNEKGIALFDVALEVRRNRQNASDQYLEIVTPLNVEEIMMQLPSCVAIATTGQKATDTLVSLFEVPSPKMGEYARLRYNDRDLRLYRMPSSSRAYPRPLEEKAGVYRKMFQDLEML